MIKTILISLLVPIFAISAEKSLQDFFAINRSSYDICGIFVSPTYMNQWGDNRLEQDQRLKPHNSKWIEMKGYNTHCEFNVRIGFCVGVNLDRLINLCQIKNYQVHYPY